MMPTLPKGACDSQIHVFADSSKYPPRHPKPLYVPPAGEGTVENALAMFETLGLDRFVITQATIYGTDASLMCDVLRAQPPDKARGIAIVDDTVLDKALLDMHEAGVRAARFNFQKRFGLVPDFADFHRQLARIGEMGWFAKVFCGPDELAEVAPELRKTKSTIVFDHMGQLWFGKGLEQPGMARLLDFLRDERFWMMLSNGDRGSPGYPWDDAVPFGRAFYEAAPDRCIWGSDWPHVSRWIRHEAPERNYRSQGTSDADRLALALRYLPDDAAIRRVFVDNPVRLFGFRTDA
jgi:predicted TIM-barrel fold metal-dependent hydrolase